MFPMVSTDPLLNEIPFVPSLLGFRHISQAPERDSCFFFIKSIPLASSNTHRAHCIFEATVPASAGPCTTLDQVLWPWIMSRNMAHRASANAPFLSVACWPFYLQIPPFLQ